MPDLAPEAMAAAELREETGLVAGRLARAGEVLQGPGCRTQRGHLFLATELTQGPPEREAGEQDLVCRAFAVEEALAMARDGTIRDALSLAALGLLRLKGLL